MSHSVHSDGAALALKHTPPRQTQPPLAGQRRVILIVPIIRLWFINIGRAYA